MFQSQDPKDPVKDDPDQLPLGAANPKLAPRSEVRAWTQDELTHVKAHFGLKDHPILARELSCSTAELQAKAHEVFDAEPATGPWTEDDEWSLKRYLGAVELDLLGKIIGRTVDDIRLKLVDLAGQLTTEALSTPSIAEFKRLYGTRSDEDLAIIFGRRLETLKGFASELCLSKDKGFMRRVKGAAAKTRMPRWTAAELDQLRELYPEQSNLEIARVLGRSVKSVVSKAHSMQLKKDRARLQQMGRQNVQLRQDR